MKKSVVAIMLSLVIAAGGIGAAPAYAAERAVPAEEAITQEEEGDEAQAEAREEADSDGGEDAALFVGTDGDEVGAGGGVIIIRQADLFSFGQIHGTTPFSA